MTSIILANRQYDLNKFYEIAKKNEFEELHDSIIQIINGLSDKVGAPTYKKTPIFKQNYRDGGNRRGGGGGRHKQRQQVITTEDWEAIRNFKSTKLEKAENQLDKEIEITTSLLNKLTDSNYSVISEEIKTNLTKIISENSDTKNLETVGHAIFEIGSVNKFWSKLYARLYKDLIDAFPIMYTIYESNFSKFMKVFDDIKYISADVDYDLFCEYNKENNKRRSLSSFFVHLMNNDVIQKHEILEIIKNLKNRFTDLIDTENKKDIVLEIGENLIILIEQGVDKLSDDEESWKEINDFVEHVSNLKQKNHLSLSSQIIFKFMDLREEIE